MEQVKALERRIGRLKAVAASMHEGAIHTELIPEIDKILALPDRLETRSVNELEAITRQLREYEQTFDSFGYTLLEQLMPNTGVSPVFEVVQAKERFRRRLRAAIGQRLPALGDSPAIEVDEDLVAALTRYSLSIGTPPVTADMRQLVSRTLFGQDVDRLAEYVEVLDCDRIGVEALIELLRALVDTSMHYCTAAEEAEFLRESAEFVNFEGGRLFNRVVITESPRRVIEIIEQHVFDKFGPQQAVPVKIVDGVDRLDAQLIAEMQAEPNRVFVVRVTRIPHRLFSRRDVAGGWVSVIGRLLLIDCSARAARSATTVVYTLFPHVARTLRNIQTSLAGRPANTQLQLRRLLERFAADDLAALGAAIDRRLADLKREGVLAASVEEIRAEEWSRDGLFDFLTLAKLRRALSFFEAIARGPDAAPSHAASSNDAPAALKRQVAERWMRYFYGGLPTATFGAIVVPGGGRGALTLVGEYHRQRTRDEVERFRREQLQRCRERLEEIKSGLEIPASSTDEIEAAIRQSQLEALSPSQWQVSDRGASLAGHLTRTVVYRAAEAAGVVAARTREGIDRAAFGNVTGGAAALIKRAMGRTGFAALHGRLEDVVGKRINDYDRRLRDVLAPLQDLARGAQRSLADLKGELDPVAVSEIEAVLNIIEQGSFYPTLILPEMRWTYRDVFPEKDYPLHCVVSVPLNDRHELDPLALLRRLEQLRYLLRRFPEIFALYCHSMLLVLNTPHNPTGAVYRRETVLRLLQIAADYDIAVLDDNAYHKLVTRQQKDREGDACVAQVYEAYKGQLSRPVRLLTVGATTKGLQGAGDRTGLLHANFPEVLDFVEKRASEPHYLSLYSTLLKLESGLAAKRCAAEVERLAAELVDPTVDVSPWQRLERLLASELEHAADPAFPVAVFEPLLAGYERLLRLKQRGASVRHLSLAASDLLQALKQLRLERRLRSDVQQRLEQAKMALLRVSGAEPAAELEFIEPQGAFYCCLRLCGPSDQRGLQPFLEAIADARGVDFTRAGSGYVRMSLGGPIEGDRASYDRLGHAIEVHARLLRHYWTRFDEGGRDPALLETLFDGPPSADEPARADGAPAESAGDGPQRASSPALRRLAAAVADLRPLVAAHPPSRIRAGGARGLAIEPSERGLVYCIEEGRSVTDKLFVEVDRVCDTVDELLRSRPFRVLYRRLLKKVFRRVLPQSDLSFEQVENQYGPLACLTAYRDRQLIDRQFRELMRALYREWHGAAVARVLLAHPAASSHAEKTAAMRGINSRVNELLDELLHAFGMPAAEVGGGSAFDVGVEALGDVTPHPAAPPYLQRLLRSCTVAGATCALDPAPRYTTGAVKRIGDYRYGFIRRDADGRASPEGDGPRPAAEGPSAAVPARRAAPPPSYFQRRLDGLSQLADYVCKAVQVGPFKMLLCCHRSMFHQINDELRLFPQIEAVQLPQNLQQLRWDGVLLFGVPTKLLGDSYRTGYVIDRYADGALLPTAWVAREDDTDYVGFLKKSLLTLHNERVKAMGGMPVHGSMITITFKNGLRKTLVFSADSGTGKSETITAMMEQMVSGGRLAAVLDRIDILAGDMLSLWRGEDDQVYAFGTETGDFMRLSDITETWKQQFGDLLRRGSFSNPDHPKNPRVTIPGICERAKVLSPTRVNAFFYINNYELPAGRSVELIEDPHQVLKQVLVRGLRKNKGTSGDQPSLRAGFEVAGETGLVVRFRYALDRLLTWQETEVDGARRTCLRYRDGADDVYTAREVVSAAFVGRRYREAGAGEQRLIEGVDFDVMRNLFWLSSASPRHRTVLDRTVYDQIYEPLVSTFCGNPFVDPAGMDRTLGVFAETMHRARVHTGVLRTQLARPGYEFAGPRQAAEDIVDFLLEDEEVNARFQRNKNKVALGMQTYGEMIEPGSNLPVDLEGYNLLLLEAHESQRVEFVDLAEARFNIPTPYYRYERSLSDSGAPFRPAIALPAHLETIRDICERLDLPTPPIDVDLRDYDRIRSWNSREELIYQVLLLHRVITLGCSETELARFPCEVRKARDIAERLAAAREPRPGPPALESDEGTLRPGVAAEDGFAIRVRSPRIERQAR